ncbi:MAG: glutathione S-transferase N-terminal domain-containing protein [Pseudomonadota bacterium]|nr:glutathione S-transferase N-terminal domain-containing protein [Pseudomonadota bacterium]
MTMKLLLRGPSPFGRKCTFALQHLELSDQIRVGNPENEEHIRTLNPLAKVPTLTRDDGEALFDSRVILEFFDHLAGGGKIIPVEATARFKSLRLAAMADGILEAALLITYEGRYRPDQDPYEPWLDFQRGKIQRSLTAISGGGPGIDPPMVDGIGLACALEYMDFREQYDWRPEFPVLISWLDDFNAANPTFAASRPSA